MGVFVWILWGLVLIIQSISFTIVSRARNSGSLRRHLIAGLFSNGVWFLSQLWIIHIAMEVLTGKFGLPMQIFAVTFYALFNMLGSLLAHWWSLKSESGKSSVGASHKYKQITIDEWNVLMVKLDKNDLTNQIRPQ